MKRCTKCDRVKPLSEFYELARGGHRADCRACCVAAYQFRVAARRAGVPPRPVGLCEDCGAEFGPRESYKVIPPDRPPFRLCVPCWNGLVGAKVMEAVR